jgi:hypothetical protein
LLLQDLADDLRSCLQTNADRQPVSTLSTVNCLSLVDNDRTLRQVLNKFLYLQNYWRAKVFDTRLNHRNSTIFAQFVERAAREVNDPVFGVRLKQTSKHDQVNHERKEYRQGTNHSVQQWNNKQNQKLFICHEDHALYNCGQFKALNVGARHKYVKENAGACDVWALDTKLRSVRPNSFAKINDWGGTLSWLFNIPKKHSQQQTCNGQTVPGVYVLLSKTNHIMLRL